MTESKSLAGTTPPGGHGATGPVPNATGPVPNATGPVPADPAAALAGARRPGPTAEDEAYEIHIARDGTWHYHGSPIGRIALCKLFSTVLKRDDAGDYWLITPAERGRITVEDAPFVAVEVRVGGQGRDQVLTFRTNLDHEVAAGPDHPIRVETDPDTGEPSPYILVRDRLEARINRPVFYELVERSEAADGAGAGDEIGIWSMGTYFPLGRTTG